MRCERKKEIKEMKTRLAKRLTAAAAAFLIVFAMAAVDRNCAEAAGQDELIIPRIILVEEGTVKISWALGEIFLSI
ncbi:MAG: hypothetical protein Q4C14_02985 [Bacillota bacterium]|nr:hypothetical protein [Bacillota bacterium]